MAKKDQTSVLDIVDMMFKRSGNEKKSRQLRSRLFEYITSAVGAKNQAKRIDEIAHAMFPKRNLDVEIHDGFWGHFTKHLFEINSLGLFFEYLQIAVGEDAEIRDPARERVILEFYRTAGDTEEFAIKFALQALEEYGDLARMVHVDGAPIETTITQHRGAIALLVLQTSTATIPHVSMPQRLWFSRLIHATKTGDPSINQILSDVLVVRQNMNPKQQSLEITYVNPDMFPLIIPKEYIRQLKQELSLTSPRVLITMEEKPIFEAWQQRFSTYSEIATKAGNKIMDWIDKHHDEFLAAKLKRQKAIVENPKRGLRPGGADLFKTKLSPIYNVGIRALSFVPDGYQFPNTSIRTLIHIGSPHLLAFSGELIDFELKVFANSINLEEGLKKKGGERIIELLEFVAIDVLYRIVASPTAKNNPSTPQTNSTDEKSDKNGDTHAVRPHLRRLLPGQKASEEAISIAATEMNWKLPPGITFVRAHYRGDPNGGGHIEHNIAAPIMTYTDADLTNALGMPV